MTKNSILDYYGLYEYVDENTQKFAKVQHCEVKFAVELLSYTVYIYWHFLIESLFVPLTGLLLMRGSLNCMRHAFEDT